MSYGYEVDNFTYDGFIVNPAKGKASYMAEFIQWTPDPGVALCKCSDGDVRRIPSCQLVGFACEDVIEQEKSGLMFGVASHS